MIKILFFIAALYIAPGLAYSECGDNICGLNEDTRSCPIDCRAFGKSSPEQFVGKGPEIRGAPFGKGMVVTYVIAEKRRAVLRLSIFDADLKVIYQTDVLSRPQTGKGELGNPQPLMGPDGTVYIAFRDHQLSDLSKPYRLRVIKSSDNGRTWDYLDDDHGSKGIIDVGAVGLWEPFLYFDGKGNLRVVYAKERSEKICAKQHGEKQDVVTRVSLDHGKTWIAESVVASEGVSREGVPSVARLSDGSYILVFESWQSSACGSTNPSLLIRAMQSPNGIDWDKRSVVFDPYSYSGENRGARATWPFVATLNDGRAIVSFTSNFRNIDLVESNVKPERDKTFDVFMMSSTGNPVFNNLRWDKYSLVTAFSFKGALSSPGRYASSVVLEDGRIVVFSGLPNRFVVVKFKE